MSIPRGIRTTKSTNRGDRMTPQRLESAVRETGVNVLPWISAALVVAYGGVTLLFSTFLTLILCDWAMGLLAARIRGEDLCWEKAVRGWYKFLAYLVLLVALHRLDVASIVMIGIGSKGKLMDNTLIGLCGYEFWSVLRNAGRCGIAIPAWLRKLGERLKSVFSDEKGGD